MIILKSGSKLILLLATWGWIVTPFPTKDTPPDKQLEHFISLINSAILAEGLITNKTDIWNMTTDWMIIDNMPKDSDWISTLRSNPRYAQIQKLLQQFGPLHDVIKHGFKNEVPIDFIDEFNKMTQNLPSVSNLIRSSQKALRVAQEHMQSFDLYIYYFKKQVRFFELAQREVPQLVELLKEESLMQPIEEGISFIKSLEHFSVYRVKDSLKECKLFNDNGQKNAQDEHLLQCIDVLFDNFKNVSVRIDEEKTEQLSLLFNAFNLQSEASDYMEKFKNESTDLIPVLEELQKFSIILDISSTTYVSDEEKADISSIKENFNFLKSRNETIQTLADALNILQPISEVIKMMTQNSSYGEQENKKSSNHFTSYRGFPNGTNSLHELFGVLGSEDKIPVQFQSSEIAERVNLMKAWSEKIDYFLRNAHGLAGAFDVLSNTKAVSDQIGTINFDETYAQLENERKYLNKLPAGEKVPEMIAALNAFQKIKKSYRTSDWMEEVYKIINEARPWSEASIALNKLFPLLPKVAEFVSYLPDFEEMKEKNMSAKELTDEEKIRFGKGVMKHYTRLQELTPALRDFWFATVYIKELPTVRSYMIEDIEGAIAALKNVSIPKQPILGTLSMSDLNAGFDSYGNLRYAMGDIKKRNITGLESLIQNLVKIEKLRNSIITLPASFDLNATKSLLEAISTTRPEEMIDLQDEEPNGFMLNLMSGNPFGSDVMQDLSTGVLAFRKLVEGIDVSKLAGELMFLEWDEEAKRAFGQLIDGVEYIQIPTNPQNVFNMFDDKLNLPNRIRKVHGWVRKILRNQQHPGREYLNEHRGRFSTIYALVERIQKPMEADFEIFSERIEFVFKVLQKGKYCNRKDLSHPDCIAEVNSLPVPKPIQPKTTIAPPSESSFAIIWLILIISIIIFIAGLLFGLFWVIGHLKRKGKKNASSSPREKLSPGAIAEKRQKEERENLADLLDIQYVVPVMREPIVENVPQMEEKGHFFDTAFYFAGDKIRLYTKLKEVQNFITQAKEEFGSLDETKLDISSLPAEEKSKMLEPHENRVAGAQWSHNLVKLPSGRYIPASKIGGFKERKYIATEAPLKSGIDKFLEMLFVEEVGVIVQLCSTAEMQNSEPGRESTPYENVGRVGDYKVEKNQEESDIRNVDQTKLTITNTSTGKSIQVTHFVYQSWPATSVPDNHDTVVELLLLANSLTSKDSTCLVHSLKGTGRTMTFIMFAKCIDNLNYGINKFLFISEARRLKQERNMGFDNALQYMFVLGLVSRFMLIVKDKEYTNSFWSTYCDALDILTKKVAQRELDGGVGENKKKEKKK